MNSGEEIRFVHAVFRQESVEIVHGIKLDSLIQISAEECRNLHTISAEECRNWVQTEGWTL